MMRALRAFLIKKPLQVRIVALSLLVMSIGSSSQVLANAFAASTATMTSPITPIEGAVFDRNHIRLHKCLEKIGHPDSRLNTLRDSEKRIVLHCLAKQR